ncbi:MAG: RDD family protein [Armatimonadota bacterium]
MSNPSGPSLRDQGIQALRAGDLGTAIDLLARAVMLNDADAEAKAFLGVAYSQKGLHAQAKRALQTAIELQPQNANFHYNLGVALERAGDMQGAVIGYRDALVNNKDHAQAKAKLQAMGAAGQQLLANAPKPVPPVGVPSYSPPPAAAPHGGPPGGFAPPAPAPSYQPAAAPADAPPGTVQCPGCGQFSHPGLACEFCSSPLPVPVSTAPPPSQYTPYGAAPVPIDPAALAHSMNAQSTDSGMGGFQAFAFRWMAVILDHLILMPFWIGFALLMGVDFETLMEPSDFLTISPRQAGEAQAEMTASIFRLSLLVGYETVLTAVWGRTLGKMALGLRVVDEMGDQVGWLRAFMRSTVGRLIGGCLCGLGYLSVIWNDEQRGWHDTICGTHVVRR